MLLIVPCWHHNGDASWDNLFHRDYDSIDANLSGSNRNLETHGSILSILHLRLDGSHNKAEDMGTRGQSGSIHATQPHSNHNEDYWCNNSDF